MDIIIWGHSQNSWRCGQNFRGSVVKFGGVVIVPIAILEKLAPIYAYHKIQADACALITVLKIISHWCLEIRV